MSPIKKTSVWSIGLLSLLLVSAAGAAPLTPGASPPPGAHPENIPPGLADRDGDRISDILQAKLAAADPGDRFQVIVTFSASGSPAAAVSAAGDVVVHRSFKTIRGFSATVTAASALALARTPGVLRVEENFTVRAALDTARADFGVDAVHPAFGLTGSGVGICVIDSGVDTSHEQLDNNKDVPSDSFVKEKGRKGGEDIHPHGTHVASIAAGDGEGGSEAATYKGVAPGALVYSARVLNKNGEGTAEDVIAGIEWCASQPGVKIINMSLGSTTWSDGLDSVSLAANCAANPLWEHPDPNAASPCADPAAEAKVVVAAAGNMGAGWISVGSPGAAKEVITVGAVADPGEEGIYLAPFSSRGPTLDSSGPNYYYPARIKPDITAPGVRITAAEAGTVSGYSTHSGTSMATPFVAGTIALALQANPDLTLDQVRGLLESTAQSRGLTCKDVDWGDGLLDALAFVAAAAGVSPSDPSALPTKFPTYHQKVKGTVGDAGEWFHKFDVTDTSLPIAATVSIDCEGSFLWCIAWAWVPDLEAELQRGELMPDDTWTWTTLATSQCPGIGECGAVGRQETLHVMPTLPGTYRVRVYPYAGEPNNGQGGSFVLELSKGPKAPPSDPGSNALPVADAGADQTVNDSNGDGTEPVTLDGTGSSDSDGYIVSYVWSEGSKVLGSGKTLTVALGVGEHTISLVVKDDDCKYSEAANVTVTVTGADPAGALHVGDLDGSATGGRGGWTAEVTVTVHTSGHQPVEGATVTGSWSDGYTGPGACSAPTDINGQCTVTSPTIPKRSNRATFRVDAVSHGAYPSYWPAANHDPDGDSGGTSITVWKP